MRLYDSIVYVDTETINTVEVAKPLSLFQTFSIVGFWVLLVAVFVFLLLWLRHRFA